MGSGRRPKLAGRLHDQEGGGKQGLEAFDYVGYGTKDPNTGLYESYGPAKHLTSDPGRLITLTEVFEQWALVEFSFESVLHIDLSEVWVSKSWRWFKTRLQGLLTTASPLSEFFADDTPPSKTEAPRE